MPYMSWRTPELVRTYAQFGNNLSGMTSEKKSLIGVRPVLTAKLSKSRGILGAPLQCRPLPERQFESIHVTLIGPCQSLKECDTFSQLSTLLHDGPSLAKHGDLNLCQGIDMIHIGSQDMGYLTA